MADGAELIAAFTEPSDAPAPGELVRFVNISEVGPDVVRIKMRDRDGTFTEMNLSAEEWDDFRSDVINNG